MFDFIVPKFIRPSWLRILLEAIILATIISTIIAVFTLILNGTVTLIYFAYSFLFSFSIGYIITLGLKLIRNIKFVDGKPVWVRYLTYYAITMFCTLFATELSLFIIHLIENEKHIFFNNSSSIKFNATIAFIATTVIGLYQSQKEQFIFQITKKEFEILKMQQLKTNAELETLQSRINPHFLYNSLNSIASLIHSEPDLAEEMTLRLSKLFRYSINSQNENKTKIKEEIDIVQNYLAIETLRFGNRISFKIQVDQELENFLIPRFLIQPLVENAIKHGLHSVVEKGEILIDINKEDNKLIISVGDNGIAFPENLQAGYGMQSTYDKLNLLYPSNYKLELINSPNKKVRIELPIEI